MAKVKQNKREPPETKEQKKANPLWIRVSEFARRFAMSKQGVHNAIKAGKILAVEVPAAGDQIERRIPWSEVERIEAPLQRKKAAAKAR